MRAGCEIMLAGIARLTPCEYFDRAVGGRWVSFGKPGEHLPLTAFFVGING